jgi:hypothetical protein
MRFEVGNFIIDVDIPTTKQVYSGLPFMTDKCNCDGCKNYLKASSQFPEVIKDFFDSIGVNINKPAEDTQYSPDKDHVQYGGFYHLCGKIIKGESAWESISDKKASIKKLNESKCHALTKDFLVWFQGDCSLLEDSFNSPCFQMEILATVPWVIREPNYEGERTNR